MKIQIRPLTLKEKAIHDRAVLAAKTHKECELDLISIIEEVDRLRLFEKFGETSTIGYCIHVLGLEESVSYNIQGIARKSRLVPELKLAVEEGKITVVKAGRLVPQITPENSQEWIEIARTSTKSKLEQKLAAANPKKRKRSVKKPIDKTHTRYAADFPNRVLEKLKRVQDLECQRTRKFVSEVEAYESALDSYLERRDPVVKAERAKSRETSAQAKREAACGTQANSQNFPQANLETQAKPENLARAKSYLRQPLDAKTRNAVNDRDRGQCQTEMLNGEICGETKWVEIHHKNEVANGGTNELENLITLCSAHHRQHHSRVESPTVAYALH